MTNGILDSSQKIVTSGLVLNYDAAQLRCYPKTGTAIKNLASTNNNGTLVNGVAFNSENGGSLVFDGINDYITLGSTLAMTPAGTISFWIKLTNPITTGYASNQRPFGKNTNFECRWGGSPVPLNNRRVSFDINSSDNVLSNKTEWLNTIYYNITLTYNSAVNVSYIYIQGIQDAIGTAGNPSLLSGNFIIGATNSLSGFVNGKISMFSIYNRALSADEVLQNFNANRSRYGL